MFLFCFFVVAHLVSSVLWVVTLLPLHTFPFLSFYCSFAEFLLRELINAPIVQPDVGCLLPVIGSSQSWTSHQGSPNMSRHFEGDIYFDVNEQDTPCFYTFG